MIQRLRHIIIIILVLFLYNTGNANIQQNNNIGNKEIREKATQVLKLWENVNYQPETHKDPYTIEIWEQLLSEQYALALQIKDQDLQFKLSFPLSYTYHSTSKFKKGIPLLEALLKQKEKLDSVQYKEVLIKLEEEYRASNNIEKAILIRKERINENFINNYWEIYRDCGLYNAAKNDLLKFVKVPELYSTKRLSYYFLLGDLYVKMKAIDSAKNIYTIALQETEETIVVNKKTKKYADQKLAYWKACFMGLIVKCNIEKGNFENAITPLKFDIAQSFENSDNKVNAMTALSKVFIHNKQYKEAKIYLDSAAILLTEKISNNLQVEHLLVYSDYYFGLSNTDSALYYFKKYNNYKEDLYQNIQKNQSVLLLAQLEIANRRDELLASNQSLFKSNKENTQQKIILLGLLFSLVLSIVVGGIIYVNSLSKSRYTQKIKTQSKLINEHADKIEAQFNHNELLLKELHHRVKNNLQVMYSLLNLQKRRNIDPDTIETLSSIQNRIQTMALVHQNLYTSGDYEMVEIFTYIKTLANHLESIYKIDKKKIEMVFQIDETLKLPIETVVAIGLIVNEAVSNSFKYAFKNKQNGMVTIIIESIQNETAITIQDNGEGLGSVPNKENSLGMKLIKIMCLQLKADYSIEQTNGVTHHIKFNKCKMEKKILLLEDEIIVALDLQEILETSGYQTMVTHNHKDALDILKKYKPHLAICDINLGNGPTGIDFAVEAKSILPKLEIIYVTAFSDQKMVESADLTHPFNYIVKPWNEEQIKVSVNMAFKYLIEKMEKDSLIDCLSLSEYKILDLIAKQKKSKEIADLLFIAEKTVRNHRYNIIKKLNLPNDNNSLLKWAITHFNK